MSSNRCAFLVSLFLSLLITQAISAKPKTNTAPNADNTPPSPLPEASAPSTKPTKLRLKVDAPAVLKRWWYGSMKDAKKNRIAELHDQITAANHDLQKIEAAKIGDDYPDRQAKIDARTKQLAVIEWLKHEVKVVQAADGVLATEQAADYYNGGLKQGDIFQVEAGEVRQVIDGSTAIVALNGERFWVIGVDTNGWSDSSIIREKNQVILVVSGTHQYDTVAGSTSTIKQAKAFKLDDYVVAE